MLEPYGGGGGRRWPSSRARASRRRARIRPGSRCTPPGVADQALLARIGVVSAGQRDTAKSSPTLTLDGHPGSVLLARSVLPGHPHRAEQAGPYPDTPGRDTLPT
jgi:hypothetical protein